MPETSFKRHPRPELEDDSWLMTFADMATLLMCFFVLLFSLSKPDVDQFKKVAKALRDKGFYSQTTIQNDPLDEVKKRISLALGSSGYDKFAVVSEAKDAVEVELSSSAFFLPGAAKFTSNALPMLQMMAQQIMPLANRDITIEVEGHTDDSPVSTAQFPSNWELSGARAANIVRYLIAQGFPPTKLRAVGLADTQPKAPNRDSTGNPIPANQDLNRRVVIKLLKDEDS